MSTKTLNMSFVCNGKVKDEMVCEHRGDTLEIGFNCRFLINCVRAADSEEVVRCRECRFCEDQFMSGLWCNHPDNRNPLGCRPNDYCNDGERSEEDNG